MRNTVRAKAGREHTAVFLSNPRRVLVGRRRDRTQPARRAGVAQQSAGGADGGADGTNAIWSLDDRQLAQLAARLQRIDVRVRYIVEREQRVLRTGWCCHQQRCNTSLEHPSPNDVQRCHGTALTPPFRNSIAGDGK